MLFPIVDYISIFHPTPKLLTQWEMSYEHDLPFYPDGRTHTLLELIGTQENWTVNPKSGIFNKHFQFPDIGLNVFEGDKSHGTLFQFSGRGCDTLRENNLMEQIMVDYVQETTRIDIAIDIECDTLPQDFAHARSNNRFKISGHYDTSTGSSWYIGSRNSTRFARVYRYNPPHPRHDRLRVEYQLNKQDAKQAVESIIEQGILQYSIRLGETFGWNHPSYVPPCTLSNAPSAPRHNSKGSTAWWLHKQVVPALEKIAQKGDIDILIGLENRIRAIIDEYSSNKE